VRAIVNKKLEKKILILGFVGKNNFASKRIIIFIMNKTGIFLSYILPQKGHVCALAVGVPGYRSRGSGSIPGATRFSE
jgi:hypothetical protein